MYMGHYWSDWTTGQSYVRVQPLVNYFDPWVTMAAENKAAWGLQSTGPNIGWDSIRWIQFELPWTTLLQTDYI